jgi:hypothetical protein
MIFERLVKGTEFAFPVIPAEAGIQYFQWILDAGVRRHDASATFYGFIIFDAPGFCRNHRGFEPQKKE